MTDTLKRNMAPVRMRNYGRIIEDMVTLAANEQDVENASRFCTVLLRSAA